MPPRNAPHPASKREELKTYRELTLGRDMKNARRRRKVQANGTRRVLGAGSLSQPYLPVETARYRTVRLEVQFRLLRAAQESGIELPIEQLLEHLRPRIEALTYAQLAQEEDDAVRSRLSAPALGRELTSSEIASFTASRAVGPPAAQRRTMAASALDSVLNRVERRQVHNPARYQAIWAQLVGGEVAAQTHLERVDPTTQTAYFRCLNSALSADLQRRTGLPAKLAQALKVPVRRLRSQF